MFEKRRSINGDNPVESGSGVAASVLSAVRRASFGKLQLEHFQAEHAGIIMTPDRPGNTLERPRRKKLEIVVKQMEGCARKRDMGMKKRS